MNEQQRHGVLSLRLLVHKMDYQLSGIGMMIANDRRGELWQKPIDLFFLFAPFREKSALPVLYELFHSLYASLVHRNVAKPNRAAWKDNEHG